MEAKTYKVVQTRNENAFLVGHVSFNEFRQGWKFIPLVAGRSSSRKYHETAHKAIPAWAKPYDLQPKEVNHE